MQIRVRLFLHLVTVGVNIPAGIATASLKTYLSLAAEYRETN